MTIYILSGTQGQGGCEIDRFDTLKDLRYAYLREVGNMSLGIEVDGKFIPGDKHAEFLNIPEKALEDLLSYRMHRNSIYQKVYQEVQKDYWEQMDKRKKA